MVTSDVVFIVDGIRTLTNVVTVDPTCANLILWVTSSWRIDLMIVAQAKIVSNHNQHLEDDFILPKVEIFGCLHTNKQMTSFINVSTWHGQKRVLEVLFFSLYIHVIGRGCQRFSKKFGPSISCVEELWWLERFFLSLVSFQVFCPSLCTTCFLLLVMGLSVRFRVFYS
jgi:hypothetical protein